MKPLVASGITPLLGALVLGATIVGAGTLFINHTETQYVDRWHFPEPVTVYVDRPVEKVVEVPVRVEVPVDRPVERPVPVSQDRAVPAPAPAPVSAFITAVEPTPAVKLESPTVPIVQPPLPSPQPPSCHKHGNGKGNQYGVCKKQGF